MDMTDGAARGGGTAVGWLVLCSKIYFVSSLEYTLRELYKLIMVE
jgi:hypothetical protein